MKLPLFSYLSLLVSIPAALAQVGKTGLDGRILPKFALEDATTITENIRAEFDRTAALIGAVALSNKVIDQLKKLNTYMDGTLFPAVNPQRFYPGTPGLLRARTCSERQDIFKAYENFFDALVVAREAAGAAVCRSTIKVNGCQVNAGVTSTAIDPLTAAAKAELDITTNNTRRLWDDTYNKYNSFKFFVYHCKARNNPAVCRAPGEECPPKPASCPVVCPCYYGFIDGKNPNKDQCFTDKNRVDEVGSVVGKSSRATFGWGNIKDCRECFPNDNPLPQCLSVL
ncbi:hypothetical protein TWF718_003584 [Orbilia javanica]|uniref:Uncharacterized protein n=1 Tax=Orbilia javanica TaxID=47235 RepID=A0AAN8N108_9PEZI